VYCKSNTYLKALKIPRPYQLFYLTKEVLRQDISAVSEESLMTGNAKLCVCFRVNSKAINQGRQYCGVCNEMSALRRNFDGVRGINLGGI
jgi:hypothetical protein